MKIFIKSKRWSNVKKFYYFDSKTGAVMQKTQILDCNIYFSPLALSKNQYQSLFGKNYLTILKKLRISTKIKQF